VISLSATLGYRVSDAHRGQRPHVQWDGNPHGGCDCVLEALVRLPMIRGAVRRRMGKLVIELDKECNRCLRALLYKGGIA